ncbi:MAG: response regulator transcription factor [Anaerohalosphaera sp.]|nr:response regulator transcription factor [Anaerohalosphaera sp.]
MTVGVDWDANLTNALPVQIISSDNGMEAIRHLREHLKINAVITRWDLPDMPDGQLIRRIRAAKPSIPTVVILDEPDEQREIDVRKLGVTAVIPGNANATSLVDAIKHVLNVRKASKLKVIT